MNETSVRTRPPGDIRASDAAVVPGDATALPAEVEPAATSAPVGRDLRIDVLRGFALLTIFVDHIPNNRPALFTLHNFGFSDAAEIFVLLAGYSAMIAYGRLFRRDGARIGLIRIAKRCVRIYLYQAGLLFATLTVVRIWMEATGIVPRIGVAPLLQMGWLRGLFEGLRLNALPNYIDILPLYIVLLALFPVIYAGMRWKPWVVLGVSGAIWLASNLDHRLNLPNAASTDESGWYFNPFAWQFLFTLGVALAMAVAARGGLLPRLGGLIALCWLYLAFAFLEGAPWQEWGLPDLRPIAMAAPDKSHVVPLRVLHVLALTYLLLSARCVDRLARHPALRPLASCGRHSLEIFAIGCLAALCGRLLYRTFGSEWPLQVAVNTVGLLAMVGSAYLLDRRMRRRAEARKAVR